MKIVLEGKVTDLGNIDISKIEEIMIYVRTDAGALVSRPVDGKLKEVK
jgi:hypothetical protein